MKSLNASQNFLLISIAVLMIVIADGEVKIEKICNSTVINSQTYEECCINFPKTSLTFPVVFDSQSRTFINIFYIRNLPLTLEIISDDESIKCSIPLNLTYNSIEENYATKLGNGKILVSFVNTQMWSSSEQYSSAKWAAGIVIVDPLNCNHTQVYVDQNQTRFRSIKMIPYNDSFDMFVLEQLSPIFYSMSSYNDLGMLLNKTLISYKVYDTFDTTPVGEYDPTQGYYRTSFILITKLDSNFLVVKNYTLPTNFRDLNNTAQTYGTELSVSSAYDQFTVCVFQLLGANVKCMIFDSNLTNIRTEASLSFGSINEMAVKNLRNGGAVVFIREIVEIVNFRFRAQFISKDGKVEESLFQYLQPSYKLVMRPLKALEMQDGSFYLIQQFSDQIVRMHFPLPISFSTSSDRLS